MNRLLFCGFAMGMTVLGASGSTDVFVGNRESVTNCVPSGETQDASLVVIGEGGRVRKTGVGTWNVSAASLQKSPSLALEVQAGTVEVGSEGQDKGPVVRPEAILNQAMFWLDASDQDSSHFVQNQDVVQGVWRWHDVRETDVNAPHLMFAQAKNNFTTMGPEKVSYDYAGDGVTRLALWFGGETRGRTMTWQVGHGDGNWHMFNTRNIRHIFGVFGLVESYGFLFGLNSEEDGEPDFTPGSYGSCEIAGTYLQNSAANVPYSGNFYLNGAWIDPFTTDVRAGWQLIEFDCHKGTTYVNDFFNDRNYQADWCGRRAGGDYISEVLIFTNSLTQAQRLQVEQYLIDKWHLQRSTRTDGAVSIASGATLKVVGADAPAMTVDGCGTYENGFADAAVSLTVANTPIFDFSPLIRAEIGIVELGRAALMKVQAGDVLTATPAPSGAWVSTVPGLVADAVEKAGIEPARMASVPDGVTRLSVREGSLVLGALPREETTLPEDEGVFAVVSNPSFEFVNGVADDGDKNVGAGTAVDGWRTEIEGDSEVRVVDHINGTMKNPGTYWEVDIPPVDGHKSLMLKAKAAAYTTINFPMPGLYELSFYAACRQTEGSSGHQLQLVLIDANQQVNVFGTSIQPYYHRRFTEQRHLVRVPVSGNYTFGFRAVRSDDKATMIDKVSFRRVVDSGSVWRIPGGDFEAADFSGSANAFNTYSVENTHPGWTLKQPSGWSDGQTPGVGLSTWWMGSSRFGLDGGAYFCDSGNPAGSSVQLCFCKNESEAEMTFAPPAGTYRLRCKAARRDRRFPILTAVVKVGDAEPLSLGNVGPQRYILDSCEFPNSFNVAEGQSVTLSVARLSANNPSDDTKVIVDDFELVRFLASGITAEPVGNLVRNWSFEAGEGCHEPTAKADYWLFAGDGSAEGDGASFRGRFDAYETHFGYDRFNGLYFMIISQTGRVEQAVSFPEAGAYQLRYFAHSRVETEYGEGYENNWLRTYLRDADGKETELAWAPVNSTNFVERTVIFAVPRAGTYNIGLQGLSGSSRLGGSCRQAVIDGVSVVKVDDSLVAQPVLSSDLEVEVADGATLQLDYVGTNAVKSVRIAGRRRSGVIDAARFPGRVNGCGALYVEPHGLCIIVK